MIKNPDGKLGDIKENRRKKSQENYLSVKSQKGNNVKEEHWKDFLEEFLQNSRRIFEIKILTKIQLKLGEKDKCQEKIRDETANGC